jgi:glycosyltransferase involved in cell wall biosynthesis
MRIAQIAPLTEAVPPKLYGGTERVVSFLTEELVKMGHDVTLFASGDSQTSANLRAVWPRALRLDKGIRDTVVPHMLMMEQVALAAEAGEFDVLHFHMDYWPFSVFSRQKTPFLTTLHGRLDLPELQPIYQQFSRSRVVSISDAQREPLPQAGWLRTIHHGLPDDLLRPVPGVEPSYLAFLGRICPEKGVDTAIEIAGRIGLPLKIAAKVDRADQEYFKNQIQPLLEKRVADVEFIGEINDAQKPAFLSGAKALLFPIDWPEPFGLVMIEAMACGTPVIAFGRGSVPEVIEHGLTGYIVEDASAAAASFQRVSALSRAAIRRRFEERFSARVMASAYVEAYEEILGAGNQRHARLALASA